MPRSDKPSRSHQASTQAYARPSRLLIATAILNIALCATIIATTLRSLQPPSAPASRLEALFITLFASALAFHHYRSIFRRRPSSAQAATTIYALTTLIAATGCVINLREPLRLLGWLAIGTYAAWCGYAQSRWARTIACPLPGICRNCSYDLTGNTSGTCPECGTPCPPKPRRYVNPSPEDLQ